MTKRYNVRAYALIEHNNQLLLTDELRLNTRMTKLPGGGHEWGEGLEATIRRECREELNQEPLSVTHFYTTDFFVASAFRPSDQLIAVYYRVLLPAPELVPVVAEPFAFPEETDGAQVFRWIPLHALSADMCTYPIDQHVIQQLLAQR